MTIRPVGDRAVLVELSGIRDVHRMWAALGRTAPAGWIDAVPGATTILLVAAEPIGDPVEATADLPRPSGPLDPPGPPVTIPVSYDGPDLDEVARLAGVSRAEAIRLHSGADYRVDFLGFSPGFAYLSGGPPALAVPRLDSPRTAVPAGSVAVAAGLAAVYPQSTPGGWRLIGRSGAVLFDPDRPEPALLGPGAPVRFTAVGMAESPASSLQRPLVPPARGAPAVEVLEAGPMLTVQDGGRPGWAHVGVPRAGALDRRAASLANRLVANPAGAALFEATLGGCRIRLLADRRVAVTGAAADVTVAGLPARGATGLPLRAGTELTVGPGRNGVRTYLAIEGGLDAPEVLGSRSTDTLSGLGPPPLRAGDVLGVGPLRSGGEPGPDRPPPGRLPDGPVTLTARLGPRDDWLSRSGRRALMEGEFVVGRSADRTGVRLEGPTLERGRPGEIPSEGMVAGAVQVPPDGQPIVLLRNHPTTGGYPVVAVVDDLGVDLLAQAAPGAVVRFAVMP